MNGGQQQQQQQQQQQRECGAGARKTHAYTHERRASVPALPLPPLNGNHTRTPKAAAANMSAAVASAACIAAAAAAVAVFIFFVLVFFFFFFCCCTDDSGFALVMISLRQLSVAQSPVNGLGEAR
jgi:hypothetical protein